MDHDEDYRSKVKRITDARVDRFLRLLQGSALCADQTNAQHAGHRQRLRKAVMRDAELNGLSETELLEMLLTFVIPHIDVKPAASALLARFGSLAGVLSAQSSELAAFKEMTVNGAALLPLLRIMTGARGKHCLKLATPCDMINFLVLFMLSASAPGSYAAYLNSRFKVIAFERHAELVPDSRAVAAAAARHAARFVIIAGYANNMLPQAFACNRKAFLLNKALDAMGVRLLDCLMFTDYGYFTLGSPPKNGEFIIFSFIPDTLDAYSAILVDTVRETRPDTDNRLPEAAATLLT